MAPRVGVVDYAGAQAASVLGLRDLLATAARLDAKRRGVACEAAPGAFVRVVRATEAPPRLRAPLDVLVLPPSLEERPPSDIGGTLVRWLRAQHGRGTVLCSVCAGAFLLAETGLLDGRRATTHWALAEAFSGRFPRVRLDVDSLVVDEGDLITAGGVMAWVDVGLRLVGRFFGPSTVLALARQFLVDPGGREQRFYAAFSPVLTHGDGPVFAAQRWLQHHSGERVDVARMAAAARLGTRTFLRRFHRATGLRPTEYLQHLRVASAREFLERTDRSLEDIASRVGYDDVGAFRKMFQRLVGLTPTEYRRRFAPGRSRGAVSAGAIGRAGALP